MTFPQVKIYDLPLENRSRKPIFLCQIRSVDRLENGDVSVKVDVVEGGNENTRQFVQVNEFFALTTALSFVVDCLGRYEDSFFDFGARVGDVEPFPFIDRA